MPLLFVLLNILNVTCNVISVTEDNQYITGASLPRVVTLQTYKDWSSRLGSSSNTTTPKTTLLVLQESQNVETTQRNIDHPMVSSTEDTIENMRESLVNKSPDPKNPTKKDEINAHNIAAQVLSKFVHISPLLALPSNMYETEISSHRLNHNLSALDRNNIKDDMRMNQKLDSIDSLNEIDIDSSDGQTKSERKSASGISFPIMTLTTVSTTTDIPENSLETSTTEMPSSLGHQDYPHPDDDEDEEHHDHSDHPSDDDEPTPPDDPEDYEDDEELESFRYPVRVTFHDSDDDPIPARDSSPPFIIPNIDLNPEALKQKGCRTVTILRSNF